MKLSPATLSGSVRPAWDERWAFVCIAVVALLLRIIRLETLPLWLDEAFSLWFSIQPIDYLWTTVPSFETHPPFYYTLLHEWIGLFGTRESALRSMSLIANMAALPLIWLATRESIPVLGPRYRLAPLGATLLFALTAIQIHYAIEARPYALLASANMLALVGALFVVRRPTYSAGWIMLVTGMALTIWSHALGVMYVASIGLALAVAWATDLKRDPRFLIRLTIAALIVLAVFAPLAWLMADRVANWSTSTWVPLPRFVSIGGAIIQLYGVAFTPKPLSYAVTLLAGLLAGVGAVAVVRRSVGTAAVFVFAAVLPIVFSLVITFVSTPVFVLRTLFGVNTPFLVLVALGFCALDGRVRLVGIGVAFVALIAGLHYEMSRSALENWPRVAQILVSEMRKGDVILALPNSVALPLDYYLERAGSPILSQPVPRPFPALDSSSPYPSGQRGEVGLIEADAAMLQAVAAAPSITVWTVTRMPGLFDPQMVLPKTLGAARLRTSLHVGGIKIDSYRLSDRR